MNRQKGASGEPLNIAQASGRFHPKCCGVGILPATFVRGLALPVMTAAVMTATVLGSATVARSSEGLSLGLARWVADRLETVALQWPRLLPFRRNLPGAGVQFPPTDGRGASGGSVGAGGRFGDPRWPGNMRFGATASPAASSAASSSLARPLQTSLCQLAAGEGPRLLLPRDQPAQTAQENPTIYVYVPQTKALTAQWRVSKASGERVEARPLRLSGERSIVQFPLLQNSLDGEGGAGEPQRYRLEFVLGCDLARPQQDRTVTGQLQRRAWPRALAAQLSSPTPPATATVLRSLLAEQLWFEALFLVVREKRANPKDPGLKSLLGSAGLVGDWAELPIVTPED